MSDVFDLFKNDYLKPENLFNTQNPLAAAAVQAHRALFNAFDSSARASLTLAEDLLDINRKRVDALYAVDTLSEVTGVHKDIALEAGKRFAAWGEELGEVLTGYQSGLTAVVADALKPQPARPRADAPSAKAA